MVGDIPLMEITRTTVAALVRSVEARHRHRRLAAAARSCSSPVLLLAALAIVVTMGCRHLPPGAQRHDLKPFAVLQVPHDGATPRSSTGPVLAEEDDPRVTPVGRFLRRYRIDELPQLVNILDGRDELRRPAPRASRSSSSSISTEIPGYRERFRVKPGVTGLAQVMRRLRHDPGAQAQVRPHLYVSSEPAHGRADRRRDPPRRPDRRGGAR